MGGQNNQKTLTLFSRVLNTQMLGFWAKKKKHAKKNADLKLILIKKTKIVNSQLLF